MTAFNVVRFKVKPGYEQTFIDAHRKLRPAFGGFLGGSLIRTGDQTFCFVGEWRGFRSIEIARPQMIDLLDEFRHMLDDLGGELGVTDPVSGEAVVKVPGPKAAKKKVPTRRKPMAKKSKKVTGKAGKKTARKR